MIARALGVTCFALLETAYFGGQGTEAVAVYEFDALELENYRSFERFFETYL